MCDRLCLMQENAAVLLGKQLKNAQWHRMMSPYWDSLPGMDSGLLCRHLFTEQEAAMLQSKSMVRSYLPVPSASSQKKVPVGYPKILLILPAVVPYKSCIIAVMSRGIG